MRRCGYSRYLTILLILCTVLPLLLMPCGVADNETDYTHNKYKKLEVGEHEAYKRYYIEKGDMIEAEINVLSGGYIDVYLFLGDQYDDYVADANDTNTSVQFSSISDGSRENTKSFEYKFEARYDGPYYIVIDNRNNSRPNDAVPTGAVEVEVKYKWGYSYYDGPQMPFERADFTMMAVVCISGIIIVVIVIVVIIIVAIRSGRKKPPRPPQMPPYPQYPPPLPPMPPR